MTPGVTQASLRITRFRFDRVEGAAPAVILKCSGIVAGNARSVHQDSLGCDRIISRPRSNHALYNQDVLFLGVDTQTQYLLEAHRRHAAAGQHYGVTSVGFHHHGHALVVVSPSTMTHLALDEHPIRNGAHAP